MATPQNGRSAFVSAWDPHTYWELNTTNLGTNFGDDTTGNDDNTAVASGDISTSDSYEGMSNQNDPSGNSWFDIYTVTDACALVYIPAGLTHGTNYGLFHNGGGTNAQSGWLRATTTGVEIAVNHNASGSNQDCLIYEIPDADLPGWFAIGFQFASEGGDQGDMGLWINGTKVRSGTRSYQLLYGSGDPDFGNSGGDEPLQASVLDPPSYSGGDWSANTAITGSGILIANFTCDNPNQDNTSPDGNGDDFYTDYATYHLVAASTTANAGAAEATASAHQASVPLVDTAYTDLIQSLTPDGYWPLDDASGNFRDASGNGFAATANSSGSIGYRATGPTIDSEAQSAVNLLGTDSEYGSASGTIDNGAGSTLTVSAWFKTTGTSEAVVAKYATGARQWRLYIYSGGSIGFETFQDDGTTQHAQAATSAANDGTWHHAVGWIDSGGDVHITLDGSTTVDDTTPVGTYNADDTAALNIGSGSGFSDFWTGDLAHVAVWFSDIGSAARGQLYTGQVAGATADAATAAGTAAAGNATAAVVANTNTAPVAASANTSTAKVAATAGVAAATAAANAATASIVATPGIAQATAAALDATAATAVTATAGAAEATAAGYAPSAAIVAATGSAAGTAAAADATASITATLGVAQSMATANDATVSAEAATTATAGVAEATAAGQDATAHVAATAGASAATAAGVAPSSELVTTAGTAQVTAAANDATVSTAAQATADAGAAEATAAANAITAAITATAGTAQAAAAANDATAAVTPTAGVAASTAAANAAAASIVANAGTAEATAAANDATFDVQGATVASAGVAAAVAAAWGVQAEVIAVASLAEASAAANDATASAEAATTATAGIAQATAAVDAPSATVQVGAATATTSAAGVAPRAAAVATAGTASATAAANVASGQAILTAGAAAAVAEAWGGLPAIVATAGDAQATATASDPRFLTGEQVTATAGVAEATATSYRAYWALPFGYPGSGTATTGHAAGSATVASMGGTATTSPGSGSAHTSSGSGKATTP